MTRRRTLLAAPLAVLAAAAAHAQAPRQAHVAVLGGSAGLADPGTRRNIIEPLRDGLRALGWVEGRNLAIEWRFAEGMPERLPALLAEALAASPEVLVTIGPRPALLARDATKTLPVVAVWVDNPVSMGLAASFARPGGNVTGISGFGEELVARRLQLLKELVPTLRRPAVLMNPLSVRRDLLEADLQRFGRQLGLPIQRVEASGAEQFDAAFAALQREGADGLLVLADSVFYAQRMRLGELVARQRLPSVWGHRTYLAAGGLASYQSDVPAMFRSGAAQVDKILRGAKPGEIPFEQATQLELVINLKAARALGIDVPQALRLQADEVIE